MMTPRQRNIETRSLLLLIAAYLAWQGWIAMEKTGCTAPRKLKYVFSWMGYWICDATGPRVVAIVLFFMAVCLIAYALRPRAF